MSIADPHAEFLCENAASIKQLAESPDLPQITQAWIDRVAECRYTYLFTSLGRPIIQFPQDMVQMHELIWRVRPDLIIETGIAHGGSLIHNASMLALLDLCDAIEHGNFIDPRQSKRKVLGIDIDIRAHNRIAIEAHPMASRIQMIEGSSIAVEVIDEVRRIAAGYDRILVCLDSNHTHDHVFAELAAYAPLVSEGSYCVVFDTIIENMPSHMFSARPWAKGNNPMTAVDSFLADLAERDVAGADGNRLWFEPDLQVDHKLVISVAPRGYLRRVKAPA